MIEKVISSLDVKIPEINRNSIPNTLPIVNANPQCGSLPLTDIKVFFDDEYLNLKAQVSSEFIKAQIIPRGRPHFALLHLALIDDNLATLCFFLFTRQVYGQKYRYLERGVIASFKREAFVKGALKKIPFGAIEVDGYEVRCELIKRKEKCSIEKRGIFRVSVLGLRQEDKIDVACWEGEYFRRRGVINIRA